MGKKEYQPIPTEETYHGAQGSQQCSGPEQQRHQQQVPPPLETYHGGWPSRPLWNSADQQQRQQLLQPPPQPYKMTPLQTEWM
jgi:hypothetical protein